jgi:hypothetical protein
MVGKTQSDNNADHEHIDHGMEDIDIMDDYQDYGSYVSLLFWFSFIVINMNMMLYLLQPVHFVILRS